MSTDYEPTKEQMDALAREYKRAGFLATDGELRFVLRHQHERERGLLEALRDVMDGGGSCGSLHWSGYACSRRAKDALAAHAELDAPKVPTLKTLFGNVREVEGLPPGTVILSTSRENYVAIKAAVERAEKDGGR